VEAGMLESSRTIHRWVATIWQQVLRAREAA
jgi:hypothetical protein